MFYFIRSFLPSFELINSFSALQQILLFMIFLSTSSDIHGSEQNYIPILIIQQCFSPFTTNLYSFIFNVTAKFMQHMVLYILTF